MESIFMLTTGTGRGKSYSINRFMEWCIKTPEIKNAINKFIYVTDRKENIRAEHEEFRKFLSDSSIDPNLCVRLLSNTDCITENFEQFEELGKYGELFSKPGDATAKIDKGLYSNLKSLAKEIIDSRKSSAISQKMSTHMDNELRTLESQFRLSIRRLLRSDEKFNACKNPAEIIHYMESNSAYNIILNIYTNIYAMVRPVIFITLQKGKNIFDSIIASHYEVLGAKYFLENSIVILDESDALRESLLTIEAEKQAEYDTDLIAYINLFADSLSRRLTDIESVRNDPESMDMLTSIMRDMQSLNDHYHFICPVKTEENLSKNWMFMRKESPMGVEQARNMFVQHVEDEHATYIVPDDCGEDLSFANFAFDINKLFNDILLLLKTASNAYYDANFDDNLTQREAVAKVVDYIGINGNDKNKDKIVNAVLNARKEKPENTECIVDDFYGTTNALIRAVQNIESINIGLSRHAITESPERALTRMPFNGAKVVLASATAANKSALRNFNLDWEPISSRIYHPTKHARKLEKEYSEYFDKNASLIEVSVQRTADMPLHIVAYPNHAFKDCDFSEEFFTFCITNKNQKYEFESAMKLITFVLHQCEYDITSNLCFTNKNITPNTLEWKALSFVKRKYTNVEYFFVESKNIKEQTAKFANAVRDGKIAFFITPYNTSEKGLNITVPHDSSDGALVRLSDNREPKSYYPGINDYYSIDIRGMYLTCPVHVADSIDIEEDYKKSRISQSLIAAYHAGDMLNRGHISTSQYNSMMRKILECRKYPFGRDEKIGYEPERNPSIIAKVLSMIVQSIGRISRSNMQYEQCNIMFDGSLRDMFMDVDIDDYYTADERAVMPFKVRAAIERLCDHSNWPCVRRDDTQVREVSEMIKSPNRNECAVILNALKEIQLGNIVPYDNINKFLKAFTIDREQYGKLPAEVRALYYPLKRRQQKPVVDGFEHGYSYDIVREESDGCIVVEQAYPIDAKKRNVSIEALDLKPRQVEIIKNLGFSLDDTKEYILLPNGFLKFKGNIGEAVGSVFTHEQLHLHFEAPLSELYEVVDGVCLFDDCAIAIDYKCFGEGSEQYDDLSANSAHYKIKLEKIRNKYGRPVFCIEMNTSTIDSQLGMVPNYKSIHKFGDDIQIITVPSIYDNNYNFNQEVAVSIRSAIAKFRGLA
jgi:hypothetical protein